MNSATTRMLSPAMHYTNDAICHAALQSVVSQCKADIQLAKVYTNTSLQTIIVIFNNHYCILACKYSHAISIYMYTYKYVR